MVNALSYVKNNIVYVGKKGLARYILAGLYKVFVEGHDEVVYSALGKNVSKAVAAAEALARLLGFMYIKRVTISSVILSGEGRVRRVSRIEIAVKRMDSEP